MINGQFIPSTPEVSGNMRDILNLIWSPSKSEAIDSAIHWVAFNCSSNDIQFTCRQLNMLDVMSSWYVEIIGIGRKVA